MLYTQKRTLFSLLQSVREMILILNRVGQAALQDCIEAMSAIEFTLQQELPHPIRSLDMVLKLHNDFVMLLNTPLNAAHISSLAYYLGLIETCMKEELTTQYRVLFLPHELLGWSAFTPLYTALVTSGDCELMAVPLPCDPISEIEALEQFPEGLPLVPAHQFVLQDSGFDIIFVPHLFSPADALIKVAPEFYLSCLRPYTNLLVYVPTVSTTRQAGLIDRVILGENYTIQDAYLNGIPPEKCISVPLTDTASGQVIFETLKLLLP